MVHVAKTSITWLRPNTLYTYFLPLFYHPEINIVFSKLDLVLQNRFTIQRLFSREKETNTCFKMPLQLQIFQYAFIYLYDLYKNKIFIKYKFLLIPFARCQSYKLENLGNPVQKRCLHISQHFKELYLTCPCNFSSLKPQLIIKTLFTNSAE